LERRLEERFLERRLEERFLERRLDERFLEVLFLEVLRLEELRRDRRLEDLFLETLRPWFFRHLEEVLPLQCFMALFMVGREPSACLFAFLHACNLRVQEVCLGDLRLEERRFDEDRLVDRRFPPVKGIFIIKENILFFFEFLTNFNYFYMEKLYYFVKIPRTQSRPASTITPLFT